MSLEQRARNDTVGIHHVLDLIAKLQIIDVHHLD